MDQVSRPLAAGSLMTRSLVCDSQGIIVAETVFRCVRCSAVLTCVQAAQQHYYNNHMDSDEEESGDRDQKRKSEAPDRTVAGAGERVSPSSSLSDSHPNVVKALTAAFNPCPDPDRGRGSSQMDVGANLNVINEANGNVSESPGKSGQMQCAVCGVVRFYNHIYRRFGHLSCQVCYRFFRTFFQKPKSYSCPDLGSCSLSVRNRCRACWILAAVSLFPLDDQRQDIVCRFYPRKGAPSPLPRLPPITFSPPSENVMPLDLRKVLPAHEAKIMKQEKRKLLSGH